MRAEIALRRLCGAGETPPRCTLVLAAHPDDETIGAGALLARLPNTWILHATDGAPNDMALWPEELRSLSRDEYALHRRTELTAALETAGVPHDRAIGFGARDQEAALVLVPLARWVLSMIVDLAPEVVITHPYEGGHPDHDAMAFAVHAALVRLAARGIATPALIEMTSYHARGAELEVAEFLPSREPRAVWVTVLGDRERDMKRRMIACHASQRDVLAPFPVDTERFRAAPPYAFFEPPHDGPLRYEQLGWPLTGARFCEVARAAARELGLLSDS